MEAQPSRNSDASHATSAGEGLHDTLELVEKRQTHVQRLIDKEVAAAQAFATMDRKRDALECIKRKRMHEKEYNRLAEQRLNLVQTEQALHAVKFNNVVLNAQERGAIAIEKEVKRANGVDGADKTMDRLEDAMADANELLGVASRKLGEAADLDDDELLEELEQMELADELINITDSSGAAGASSSAAGASSGVRATGPVPLAVPRTTPAQVAAAKRAEEERELAELAAFQRSMLVVETPMPMPQMAAVF